MHLHPETIENLSPIEFVTLVKGMSDQEIRDDLGGEHRLETLHAIFARFPHQFRPDMFMMGKIKARGDIGLASGLSNWFETPKS